MAQLTQTDRNLEDKMLAFAGDQERVDALAKARQFKRSWIELAETLTAVRDRESYKRWGYEDFETYCRKELHIKGATVHKLVGTYAFLQTAAPKVIERTRRDDPRQPVPSLKAVDFVARATERGAADESTLSEIRRAAFDEGAEAPMLTRRYKEVAFPISEAEKTDRLRTQILSTARRLANLIAEPDQPLPRRIAEQVEEAMGAVLQALEN
jgi:hypothetical protein